MEASWHHSQQKSSSVATSVAKMLESPWQGFSWVRTMSLYVPFAIATRFLR